MRWASEYMDTPHKDKGFSYTHVAESRLLQNAIFYFKLLAKAFIFAEYVAILIVYNAHCKRF